MRGNVSSAFILSLLAISLIPLPKRKAQSTGERLCQVVRGKGEIAPMSAPAQYRSAAGGVPAPSSPVHPREEPPFYPLYRHVSKEVEEVRDVAETHADS